MHLLLEGQEEHQMEGIQLSTTVTEEQVVHQDLQTNHASGKLQQGVLDVNSRLSQRRVFARPHGL
jgi:hypothetical protein